MRERQCGFFPMDKDVLHIITAGTMAPSGDNCQPWRFEVGPGFIDLYMIAERDYSLGNWGQRPSYIAHGAVLENMTIAAAQRGFRLSPKIMPSLESPDLVARMYLERAPNGTHPLYNAIWKRSTNRRPYENKALNAEQTEKIQTISVPGTKLVLVTDESRRQSLGRHIALFDRVLFEDRRMHSFFFSHVNWSDTQDEERGVGHSIKTFELTPPMKAGFSVFRHFPALKILNAIGLSAMIARKNAGVYSSGAAMGAVLLPNRDTAHYVSSGRLLQRVWLTSTALGLHLQPLTGIPLLMNRIADGDGTLSDGHAKLVSSAYGEICSTLNIEDGAVAFLFRIGHADPPSARTPRQKPDIRKANPTTYMPSSLA